MKRNLITIAAALALATAAHAGNNNGPVFGGTQNYTTTNNTTNAPVANGGVGHGGSSTVRNDVSSTNVNANTNSVRNDNVNAQGQQQSAISGGNKLTNEGNNSAQSTSVKVQGDSVESNTPPVMPGVLPSVPTSCRLYLFGGGSTRDGAGSGTFPIGNDQTCLSIAALNLMERAGGFTQAEKQAVVCKVEGMSTMDTCKNLGAKKSASAPVTAPAGFEHANLSDPSIRRRAGLAPL